MIKRDLVVRIAYETGLPQVKVCGIVQKTLDYIAEGIEKREKIELRDFGTFKIQHRNARIGRNPKKPKDSIIIPAKDTVVFKPGKKLRDSLKKDIVENED